MRDYAYMCLFKVFVKDMHEDGQVVLRLMSHSGSTGLLNCFGL